MRINYLEVTDLKLFKKQLVKLDEINLFSGVNLDNDSSNASGKSTIALESIIYLL